MIRPGFQNELVIREILTKDQIDIFLEKAYTIWRLPFSKTRTCWGIWRKGIGGSEYSPQRPKVEDVEPTNKRESLETKTRISGFPSPIKAEEKPDSSPWQETRKTTAPLPSRAASTLRLSKSQSQPPVLPTAPGEENRTPDGMDIVPPTVEESAASFNIDPEERELLLRIPLELFYPPPPPEHCGNGRFRWKCPIHGCVAVLDSASNYMDLFPGFSEIEAEWLRRKPENLDGEMGREVIRHIQCRHYEFHLKDSRVDLVDVGLFYLFLPGRYIDVDLSAGETHFSRLEYFSSNALVMFDDCFIYESAGPDGNPLSFTCSLPYHMTALHLCLGQTTASAGLRALKIEARPGHRHSSSDFLHILQPHFLSYTYLLHCNTLPFSGYQQDG